MIRRYQLGTWDEEHEEWALLNVAADNIGELINEAATLGILNGLIVDHDAGTWVAHVAWDSEHDALDVIYNTDEVRVTRVSGSN